MENTYRNGSIWINGVKWGFMQTYTYDHTNNGEDVYNDNGWDGTTDGNAVTKLSCEGMIPVAGDTVQIEQKVASKQAVDVTIGPINGKLHQIQMVFKEFSHKGDAIKKTDTVNYTATGGIPEMVG
jgi:hypothetical protein